MVNIIQFLTTVNRTILSGKKNEYIVIHYTGNKTDTAKANASYFKSVNRGASAHYFVDKTSIYQCVSDSDAAWSVGKNFGKNNLFNIIKNENSLNIEMCSDNGVIAEQTFNNTVDLVKSLMAKYGIPANKVVRHYDVCSKRCPGWTGWIPGDESIWNRFKASLAAAPAQPQPTPQPSASYTAFSITPFTVKVLVDDLNIRTQPSSSSTSKGYIKKSAYTITEVNNGFGKLKSGAGWIYIQNPAYVSINGAVASNTPAPAPQSTPAPAPVTNEYIVKVTASSLNIREQPNTNSKIVGSIKDKGRYTIVDTQNNWGLLKSYKTKRNGWISLAYTTRV